MNEPREFDVIKASAAQQRYCKEHNLPMFAPKNGWCYSCGRNIYEPYTYRGWESRTYGISVEEAGSRHITGCTICGRTFCD